MSFYTPLGDGTHSLERVLRLNLLMTHASVASPADHPQTNNTTAHSSAVFSFVLFWVRFILVNQPQIGCYFHSEATESKNVQRLLRLP